MTKTMECTCQDLCITGGLVKIEPRRISGCVESRCRVCGRIWKICPETFAREEVGGATP